MKKTKTIEIELILKYTIEVDNNSPIVKDYDNEKELVADLASHRFIVLPVIDNGVTITDVEVLDYTQY